MRIFFVNLSYELIIYSVSWVDITSDGYFGILLHHSIKQKHDSFSITLLRNVPIAFTDYLSTYQMKLNSINPKESCNNETIDNRWAEKKLKFDKDDPN